MTDTFKIESTYATVQSQDATATDSTTSSSEVIALGTTEIRFAEVFKSSDDFATTNEKSNAGILIRSAGPTPSLGAQKRASFIVQRGNGLTDSSVPTNSTKVNVYRASSGSVVEYAGVESLEINFTRSAYQSFRNSGQVARANDSTATSGIGDALGFGQPDAIDPEMLLAGFQTFIKAGVGSDITTYQGNKGAGLVATSVSGTTATTTSTDNIHSWDSTAASTDPIGLKKVVVGKNYLYRKGTDFNLGFETGGSTTIGTSDDASFATEDLFSANDDTTGGRGNMAPHYGKWPAVTTDWGVDPDPKGTKRWLHNSAYASPDDGDNTTNFSSTCKTASVSWGATLDWVESVAVSFPGFFLTDPLTVSFSGGGGSGATANAILSGGVVTSVTVTNGGSGYTSAPTVSFSGGGVFGVMPQATASLGGGDGESAEYDSANGQGLELKGEIVKDALTAAGVDEELNNFMPLGSYASMHVGDSVTYQSGNNFNFGNHADNMEINIGPAATFNIWSQSESDWSPSTDDVAGKFGAQDEFSTYSQEEQDKCVVVEKTLGDTYSVSWGAARSLTKDSTDTWYQREGAGYDYSHIFSTNSDTTISGTDPGLYEVKNVGTSVGLDVTGIKFDVDNALSRTVSSQAEFGVILQAEINLGASADFSIVGAELKGTFPRPPSGLNVVYKLDATYHGASTEVDAAGIRTGLDFAVYRLIGNAKGSDGKSSAEGADNNAEVVSEIESDTAVNLQGDTSNSVNAIGSEAQNSLVDVNQNTGSQLSSNGLSSGLGALGVEAGDRLAS